MVDFLDKKSEQEIIGAIREAEKWTSGEIRVHVKKRSKRDALKYAERVFHLLGMHKTNHRNGILIFVALDSRVFAIIGDQGIHDRVGVDFWDKTRDIMGPYFSRGQIKEGAIAGVLSAGEQLKAHFPHEKADSNEIPNKVTHD